MTTQGTQTKHSKRFRILLAGSLALNLLFIGIFAGAAWRGMGPRGEGHRVAGLGSFAAPYVRALPREDRRMLRDELRRAHPQMNRETRTAAYREMIAALRATPFDRGTVVAIVQGQAVLGAKVAQTGQSGWLARVEAMTQDERAAYADRLQERLDRRGKRNR